MASYPYQDSESDADFPLGSSFPRHEASSHTQSSSYADATGNNPSSSGYQYSTSGLLPQPVFSYSSPPFDQDPLQPANPYNHRPDWFSLLTNDPTYKTTQSSLSSPLTTPAEALVRTMAVPPTSPLSPSSDSIGNTPQNSAPQTMPPGLQSIQSRFPSSTTIRTRAPGGSIPQPHPTEVTSEGKEKRHHCWMCYKSFDSIFSFIPEKKVRFAFSPPILVRSNFEYFTFPAITAYKCDTCGRRFSVASNLSRHVKRCALKAVHTGGPARASGSASGGGPSSSPDPQPGSSTSVASPKTTIGDPSSAGGSRAPSSSSTTEFRNEFVAVQPNLDASSPSGRSGKRKRTSPSVSDPSSPPGTSPTPAEAQPSKPRRRRRVPAPTLWVPESLQSFDLTPIPKATPVPLPPVHPYTDPITRIYEERDSYNETTNETDKPYHPDGWKGVLPGPAIVKPEVGNVGGTLLVF
ncbi:hypothetical protein NLI96_g4688 [Meripilus lineatus]|uniref:C2H2-type domain-containing protein n=1 Tax=Meripilus lineatus TaxID=2056292 RepID=A0AAD5V9Q5_9APHY|nr:hypothetical protein NLI96_g4688 [Physisporinus lineatus]